jgi:hypothetical protein
MTRSTSSGSFANRVAVGAAFILAAAMPAQRAWAGAGTLTGTYEGKASCSGLPNGIPSKEKVEFAARAGVRVSDDGTLLVIDLPGIGRFHTFVEANSQKAGRSLVSGISCALNLDLDGATIFASGKVKGENATLKGTVVILEDVGNRSSSCKISLKRVDTVFSDIIC